MRTGGNHGQFDKAPLPMVIGHCSAIHLSHQCTFFHFASIQVPSHASTRLIVGAALVYPDGNGGETHATPITCAPRLVATLLTFAPCYASPQLPVHPVKLPPCCVLHPAHPVRMWIQRRCNAWCVAAGPQFVFVHKAAGSHHLPPCQSVGAPLPAAMTPQVL